MDVDHTLGDHTVGAPILGGHTLAGPVAADHGPAHQAPGRVGGVTVRDVAIAVGIGIVQVAGTYGAAHHQDHVHHAWDGWAVALLAVGPLALVWRRRFPVAVLAITWVSALAYWVIGYGRGPLFLALIAAFIWAVVDGHRREALVSLVAGYVSFLWLGPLLGRTNAPPLAGVLGLGAWLLVLYAAAEAIRVRRERTAERERIRKAEAASRVSEERLRIARELHDVLAHNISLINVQAATTLHRASRTEEQAYDALAIIKQVSQDTLVELRSLLGALREVDEGAPRTPAPTLARLDDLVASAYAGGVTAHLHVEGDQRPLPAAVELAAYRIVQEALTNVARHAGTGEADVRVEYGEHDLVVQVDDDGDTHKPVTPGTGITGMSERATALGGNLHAGAKPDGGFRVRAWLPTNA